MDGFGWAGRGGSAVKDIAKIIVAIIVIVILWKILKLAIGLVVGIAVIGLILFGASKLLENKR